jgi:hypothetical protein
MTANDPMAAVRQYIDGFNKGDAKVMTATFAVLGSILDGMPPHVWQGATATHDWYTDVLVEGKQHGASDYFVTLDEPLAQQRHWQQRLRGRPRDHDVQSARQAGYTIRRSVYGGTSQAHRRVAHSGLGMGERHGSINNDIRFGRWSFRETRGGRGTIMLD